MSARILVVDDEETAREELCEVLVDEGYEAAGAASAEAALELIEQNSFDVCISDIRMPGRSGIELLRELRRQSPATLVILVTAFGDMNSAIDALREGASDYLLKPIRFDDLLAKVGRLLENRRLAKDVRQRRSARLVELGGWLRGRSALMREVRRQIVDAAAAEDHVLIVGEPGTGRRQAAQAVHESRAEDTPLETLDCRDPGDGVPWQALLRRAGGGTFLLLYLDDLSPQLQESFVRSVEGLRALPRPPRLVAVVRDLKAAVAAGRCSRELERLFSKRVIELPTLRRRREDIPLLVDQMVAQTGHQGGLFGVSAAAMRRLIGYDWPGNVEELTTTLEPVLAQGVEVTPQRLPEQVRAAQPMSLQDLMPEKIGAYRIESRLGSGGMGEVYRAYDESLDRYVAIKRVSAERTDPELRARLRREARLAAQLNHPAIVQVYHLLEDEDHDHIVMELVEGESLAVHLRQGALHLSHAVALAADIAAGLAEAHDRGIVHRDLKPDNVYLTQDGRAKILDFGIAKSLDLDGDDPISDLNSGKSFYGTVYSLSPEQIVGDGVDQRSDVFAFGSLLYQMITGRRPFEAATPMQVLTVICARQQPPVREIDPKIPPDVEALVERLLAKQACDRPSTRETADELERISRRLPPPPQPTKPTDEEGDTDTSGLGRILSRLRRRFRGRGDGPRDD